MSAAPVSTVANNPASQPPPPSRLKIRRSLLDIGDDMLALDDLIEEQGGEITGCEEAVDEWFAELGTEAADKLDNYAAFIKELEARAETRKAEAARLANRARLDANAAQWLKDRMRDFFKIHEWKKLNTKRFSLSLCANGGKVPVVVSVPLEALPEEYVRTKVEKFPDVELMRAALEKGDELEFARLGERGSHVRIG